MVRLIALDLDNTLLTPEGTVSPRTLVALRDAMARGVAVVLASGRMVEAMQSIAESISVNAPLIAFNGAVAWDLKAGQAAARFPLAMEDAKSICRMGRKRNCTFRHIPTAAIIMKISTNFPAIMKR